MTEADEIPPPSVGSRWRRWDPHVHLPGTLFNDQFGTATVAEALNALAESEPSIEAVGVTDYFTTASYRRAVEAWQAGAASEIKFLFPNVELRLSIPTRAGSGVNLHLICAPEDVDWLDRFVGGLTFTWKERPFGRTIAVSSNSVGHSQETPRWQKTTRGGLARSSSR